MSDPPEAQAEPAAARGRAVDQWFHGREAGPRHWIVDGRDTERVTHRLRSAIINVNLEVVTIPVSDVDKALYFYRDLLGWRLDSDIKRPEFRVVQMTPTGDGHTSIVFGRGLPLAAEPGSMRHLELVTSDIVGTRVELAERGVEISEIYHGAGAPFFPAARIAGPDPNRASYSSYASFTDPDGNGWTLQEITDRLPGREPRN